MSMRLDRGQIEVMDDQMAEVLRGKTGAERLWIANGLFKMARQLIEASVRERHPDWDEPRIQREIARRISRGAV
jgi:hypothetical protein